MSKKSTSKYWRRSLLSLFIFFRKYPAVPYLLKWSFICLVSAAVIGSASALFLWLLDWATNLREGNKWTIVFLPIGGLAIGLLYKHLGEDIEAGNNLVIDSIHRPGQIIPFRMAPFVFLGTIVTHLFGGSAGREGTAVQMAAAISQQFNRLFKLSENEKRILLIASIAAGFGSVFGTPMAGAIFGLEFFTIGKIKYDALFPAFASAIIADIVTGMWHIHHTHYMIPDIPSFTLLSLVYSIVAGLCFGIVAAAFSRIIHHSTTFFKRIISNAAFRPMAGGVIVVLGVWLIGTTDFIGLGIPVIIQSFKFHMPAYDFAIKFAFTVITLSAGFKGGEVTPLFFIGALLGNALSLFIPLPVGLLAGMGFVAVFAGAANTPITCSIMAMELFGAACAPYVAIACVVAYFASGNNGIYHAQRSGQPKHPRFLSYSGKKIAEFRKKS